MTHLVNTILNADCVKAMKQLPAAAVNCIITDPPYGVRFKDRSGRTIKNDNHLAWLKPAFAEMYRVLTDNSFCVSFYGWTFADRFVTAFRAAGFRVIGHITFTKSYVSSTGYTRSQHECAYLLAKGTPPKPEADLSSLLCKWERQCFEQLTRESWLFSCVIHTRLHSQEHHELPVSTA